MYSFKKKQIFYFLIPFLFLGDFGFVQAEISVQKNRILKEALSAAEKGAYRTAFEKWLPLAKKGNTVAQYNIAVMYLRGDGLQRNNKLALYWLMKASKKEHALSQFTLGRMYYEGMNVKKNFRESFKWYKKAAINGHKKAINNLASMYYHGKGVKKDVGKAFKWSLKASENNKM